MPLVAHNNLPTFKRLRQHGQEVLPLERATQQDIRELHIGLLNMMPDAALAATEQQFIRLVGSCNQIAQFYVYPFSLPELNRGAAAKAHIKQHYFDFEQLAQQGLDALIITGANVINPQLEEEPFWEPLLRIAKWAESNVASVLCSCLATHALLKAHHDIDRQRMSNKKWGVYSHKICAAEHPLMRDVNTRFDAPHSRFNDISRQQFDAARLRVLVESEAGGVHLAVSPDGIRTVYFQGHPEYDAISLLKEYKREVFRHFSGDLESPPPFPENYLSPEAQDLCNEFVATAGGSTTEQAFPEEDLKKLIDNTWGDTAKSILNNWLGLVYRLTNLERQRQFMPGVDPDDPLNLSA